VGEECNPQAGSLECEPGLRCIDFGYVGICAHSSDVGEFCLSDAACLEGLFCDFDTGTCSEGAPVGAPCSFEDPLNPLPGTEVDRCAAELSCDPATLRCVDYCAPGALCGSDLDCPETYVCAIGRCRLPGEEGDPCQRPEDCRSEACDLSTFTCQALGPLGSSCTFDAECDSRYCHPSTYTCERGVAAGEPCLTGQHVECIGGWCDTTDPTMPMCREYVGLGQTCPSFAACDPEAELLCVDSVCRSLPLPNGVSCTDSSQCESVLCWQGTCQDGTPLGQSCSLFGYEKPCQRTAYCLAAGGTSGICTAKLQPGQLCETSEQCMGACVERWGDTVCDITPRPEEAVCDGA
jgi:hypothetical protein